MGDAILRNFVAQETKRNWTDEELRALPIKQCRQVGVWNDDMVQCDPEIKERIAQGKKPTAADKISALKIYNQAAAKRDFHKEVFETLTKDGGQLISTPTSWVHTKLDSTKVAIPNVPIPLREGQEETKVGIMHVAAFCSQIVRQVGGEWHAQTAALPQVLGSDGVDPYAALSVAMLVASLMAGDSVWKVMKTVDKQSTTGIRAIIFVRDALMRTTDSVYDYLSTMIVVDVLRAIIPSGKSWLVRVKETGENAIPITCYRKKIKKNSDLNMTKYPCVLYYLGGFIPALQVPVADGTLSMAVGSLNKLRIVAGSDDSTIFELSSMKGMTGYATTFGKRIQFLLSATLGAWKRGLKVDIRLTTIGDAALLLSSLGKWAVTLKEAWKLEGDDWFRFLPPTRQPLTSVQGMRSFFIEVHREGTVAIWYEDSSVPTSAEKKVAVDIEAASRELVPGDVLGNFVAFSPIFGSCPFLGEAKVKRSEEKKVYPVKKEYYAYEFGSASRFHGVISSFKSVSLYGFGWTKVGKNYDQQKGAIMQEIPLIQVKEQASWYNRVCRDCSAAYLSMFSAIHRYSPISSLAYMSKKTIQLNIAMPQMDGDLFTAAVVSKKREVSGKKFMLPVEGEEDGAEVGGEEVEEIVDSEEDVSESSTDQDVPLLTNTKNMVDASLPSTTDTVVHYGASLVVNSLVPLSGIEEFRANKAAMALAIDDNKTAMAREGFLKKLEADHPKNKRRKEKEIEKKVEEEFEIPDPLFSDDEQEKEKEVEEASLPVLVTPNLDDA